MNSQWDGRPQFYPDFGYELDEANHVTYLDFCQQEGLGHLFDESESCNSVSNESAVSNEEDEDGNLPREIVDSPPLYDRLDHFHKLHENDCAKYNCFTISPSGKSLQTQAMFPQRMLSEEKWTTKLENQAKILILKNREETESIKVAKKCLVVLNLRIAGLKAGAPIRQIEIPGEIPLAILHDRVLCPVFGWTRGYHDYRFAVPPSGYQQSPPKIPLFDIVFGAQSTDSLMSPVSMHGFYGTLRGSCHSATLCDNTVCVADFLHLPGHKLWHVLGQPGWKTEITVEEIIHDRECRRPSVLSGQFGNVPESFVISMDNSNEYCFDDFDCSGPQAFALAHEMIRRGNNLDEAAWMKSYVLKSGNVEESDFDIDRPFDLVVTRSKLHRAWRGEAKPNPEYSTNWLFNLMTSKPLNNPFEAARCNRQQAGVCNFCRQTGDKLRVEMMHCARCKNVNYCSKDCQKKDWKTHKKLCFNVKDAKRNK